VIAVALSRQRPGDDPVKDLYERFCAKLARHGIARAPAEGPVLFARRAGDRRPDLASAIESINRRYIAMRYGGIATAQQLRKLRREIAQFKP
jgi:protein-glutamine gamma-glutamyltransferase